MNLEMIQRNSPEAEAQIKISSAIIQIAAIIQIVHDRGIKDHEIPDLVEIRRQVEAGEIEPAEGIKRAKAIESRKMDYH